MTEKIYIIGLIVKSEMNNCRLLIEPQPPKTATAAQLLKQHPYQDGEILNEEMVVRRGVINVDGFWWWTAEMTTEKPQPYANPTACDYRVDLRLKSVLL